MFYAQQETKIVYPMILVSTQLIISLVQLVRLSLKKCEYLY